MFDDNHLDNFFMTLSNYENAKSRIDVSLSNKFEMQILLVFEEIEWGYFESC